MNAHACVRVLTYVSVCKTTIIIEVEEAMSLRKSWGNIGEEENNINIVLIYEILKILKVRTHGILMMRIIFLKVMYSAVHL